ATLEVLVEVRVRIVGTDAGQIDGHFKFSPRHLRMPHAGLNLLEGRFDSNLLELVNDVARDVHVGRDGAGRDGDLERLGWPETSLSQELFRFSFLLGRI